MKKLIALTLLLAILLPVLSLSAFASVDEIDNGGLLDGIGGFFRDQIGIISDGFNKSISDFKSGINAIGDFFASLAKSIGDGFTRVITNIVDAISFAISDLLDGIKRLFLPHDDYFLSVTEKLSSALNQKMGGILSLIQYFNERFASLKSNPNSRDMLKMEFPNGHMFAGARMDFMRYVGDLVPMFRSVFSAIMVIATAIFTIYSVKGMLNS